MRAALGCLLLTALATAGARELPRQGRQLLDVSFIATSLTPTVLVYDNATTTNTTSCLFASVPGQPPSNTTFFDGLPGPLTINITLGVTTSVNLTAVSYNASLSFLTLLSLPTVPGFSVVNTGGNLTQATFDTSAAAIGDNVTITAEHAIFTNGIATNSCLATVSFLVIAPPPPPPPPVVFPPPPSKPSGPCPTSPSALNPSGIADPGCLYPGYPAGFPCYCTQPSGGSGACYNFDGAGSDIHCVPSTLESQGYTCTATTAAAGQYTETGGPIYSCTL